MGRTHLPSVKASTDTSGPELLHHNMIAGGTEYLVLHNFLNTGHRFFQSFRNQHALAQSQTVCLNDSGEFVFLRNIFNGRPWIVKYPILGGGNVVLLHQILGEHLGAFNDSRIGSGAKSGKARRIQGIYHTGHQRIVRGHDHQVCLNLLCQRHDAVYIHGRHIVTHCIIGNAPIARAAMHTVHSR